MTTTLKYRGKEFTYNSVESYFDSNLKLYTHKLFLNGKRVLSFMTYNTL